LLTKQDLKIINTMLTNGAITAYAIAQETKISNPQTKYRLNKLVESSLVTIFDGENKTLYDLHPVLQSNDAIMKIMEHITQIVEIVDDVQYTPLVGIQHLFYYLIRNLEEELKPKKANTNNNSSE